MYAHGGRTVELKGELAKQRRQEELDRLKAESDREEKFAAAVARYSRPRRAIYRLQQSSAWEALSMGAILAYALMLAFADPIESRRAEAEGRPERGANAFIDAADPVFTVIFTVDLLVGLTAHGGRRFWRDPWNVLDGVVVGAGWISFVPGVDAEGIKPLRLARVFQLLSKVGSMRMVVSALVASVPGLANVLALAAFMCYMCDDPPPHPPILLLRPSSARRRACTRPICALPAPRCL
jgi:hypothetical protein